MNTLDKAMIVSEEPLDNAGALQFAGRSRMGLALLAGLGFMAGWLHAVMDYSRIYSVPMGLLVDDSLRVTVVAALLVALAVAGWLFASGDGNGEPVRSGWVLEGAVAGLSFLAASVGLRAALWVLGG